MSLSLSFLWVLSLLVSLLSCSLSFTYVVIRCKGQKGQRWLIIIIIGCFLLITSWVELGQVGVEGSEQHCLMIAVACGFCGRRWKALYLDQLLAAALAGRCNFIWRRRQIGSFSHLPVSIIFSLSTFYVDHSIQNGVWVAQVRAVSALMFWSGSAMSISIH